MWIIAAQVLAAAAVVVAIIASFGFFRKPGVPFLKHEVSGGTVLLLEMNDGSVRAFLPHELSGGNPFPVGATLIANVRTRLLQESSFVALTGEDVRTSWTETTLLTASPVNARRATDGRQLAEVAVEAMKASPTVSEAMRKKGLTLPERTVRRWDWPGVLYVLQTRIDALKWPVVIVGGVVLLVGGIVRRRITQARVGTGPRERPSGE